MREFAVRAADADFADPEEDLRGVRDDRRVALAVREDAVLEIEADGDQRSSF